MTNGSRLHSARHEQALSRRFLVRNILDAGDMQYRTPPRQRNQALGVRIKTDLDRIPKHPRGVMIANIIDLSIGHSDAKWTERFLIQPVFQDFRREHPPIFTAGARLVNFVPFGAIVAFPLLRDFSKCKP